MTLPDITVLALGGTIASVPDAEGRNARMDLSGADLLASVPQLGQFAQLRAESFRQSGSAELTFADILALAHRIDALVGQCHGIVVTQGTDTLEETAFLLDHLVTADLPVVVTGAMRNSGLPGADGPANLLHAVRVAASADARGLGTLVVVNDEIHAARFVRKMHATSTATFQSPGLGPIGWVAEDRVRIPLVPRRRSPRMSAPGMSVDARVALVRLAFDDSPALLDLITPDDFDGAVVETYGAGHISTRVLAALSRLAARMPTVFASRTGAGELHTSTCDFPGSELRLREAGLISAVALDGLKSRLLLALTLASGGGRAEVQKAFEGSVS